MFQKHWPVGTPWWKAKERKPDLVYATEQCCSCGAKLAYVKGSDPFQGYWDCSAILLGKAVPKGEEGWAIHTAKLPFVFYEIH